MTSAQRLQQANTARQWNERKRIGNWKPTEKETKTVQEVVIDPEFEALIPTLASDEYEALEASILAEGCRDALIVWRNNRSTTLVDGHNRYRLCQKHGLPFATIEHDFDTREDVIVWMVRNQLARRNLTAAIKIELALRSEEAIAQKARINQAKAGGDKVSEEGKALLLNSTKAVKPINTRAEVAAMAGTSEDTVRKFKNIIKHAPASIKEKVRSSELTINRGDELTRALQDASPEVASCVEKWRVIEPQTIDIPKRLHGRGSDSFMEAFDSGYIQPGDEEEAVSITASSLDIQRALDLKAKSHELVSRDSREQARSAVPAQLSGPSWQLFEGDLREQMKQIESESVDCIITDPPYPREYVPLYADLACHAARVLKPGGSLIVMTGQSYLPEIMSLMGAHMTYHWTLAYMTPGGQSAQLWQKNVNTFWKPVLWYVKGTYSGDWHGDVLKSERNEKDAHHWQQSLSGMNDIVHKFTLPDQLVLDPFCGSGTTGVSCATQHRRFIGIDSDPIALASASERLSECLKNDQ